MAERKKILLRLDPAVHDALARWAGDELRSTNAQIEFVLRRALNDSGRMPRGAGAIPRRGRPRKTAEEAADTADTAAADRGEPGSAPSGGAEGAGPGTSGSGGTARGGGAEEQ
ncbi:type II toxin-antitoxin system antitoxin [Nocardiopsis coralliicola]